MSATLDDYRWLVSDQAAAWLARASAIAGDPAVLVPRLRKDLSAGRAHLIAEQVELRRRGRDKFSRAEQMFFTRKGLEQATDELLAAYKAAHYPQGERAIDLCCGIGGDLLAIAARGPVLGCDLDPVAVMLAQANLATTVGNSSRSHVQVGNALEVTLAGAPWHIDPDRRPAGRRTTTGDRFEPPLDALAALQHAHPAAAIKLAPATILPDSWRERCQLEWLGSRGECRQQVAWCGPLARPAGQSAATIIDAAGGPRTVIGTGNEPVLIADGLGEYLYEPHSVVLAAKLTGVLCGTHELAAVAPGIAYLTHAASRPIGDPALAAFEILDVLPLDQKQLKAYCRERQIGRLEVKKRGVDIDPDKLRKAVIGTGGNGSTWIITPIGSAVRVVVARRVAQAAQVIPG